MMFVFAAMAEFAFVLFVKQKQAWQNTAENFGSVGEKYDQIHKVTKVYSPNTKGDGSIQEMQDQEINNIGFCSRNGIVSHDSHLTTKIDSVGFVIYCFGYLIFNFVYWLMVLN